MKILKYILGIAAILVLAFLTLGLFTPELNYETLTEIDAPLEHAFAVFTDGDRSSEWLVGLKSIENISGQEFEVGSMWRLTFEQDGEVMVMTEEVTAYKENEVFAFTIDSDVLIADVEIRFIPLDSTRTKIVATSTSVGKNILWRSMLAIVKSDIIERDQENYNRLKQLIESDH